LYSKLILVYGPVATQVGTIAHLIASNTGYNLSMLPDNANQLVKHLEKTTNYVISGLFPSIDELRILEDNFNMKIVHLSYQRNDHPTLH